MRRGSVLLAVMVIIVLAALIGTSVLYAADAQRGSATLTMQQAQLRALAWSGVQGALAELDGQRDALMRGESPVLTGSWELFEGGVTGSVRLVAMGAEGEFAASEAARLDLNLATGGMLAKLPGMSEETAAKVIAARGQGFGATEELARVDGLGASVLVDAPDGESAVESDPAPGLLTLTTVFSFDPNTTLAGLEKLNVSGGWSEELREPLVERVGSELAAVVEPLLAKAPKLAKESDLVALLRGAKVAPERWEAVLAGITTSDEAFARGRVDLNRAPVHVLAAIPGLDAPSAEKIVGAREQLGAEDRARVTWPVTQGVVPPDDFQQALPWLTTRSLQWRVRVEARLERAREQGSRLGSTLEPDAEALPPPGMVWEAVIDIADARPRVAYLRDVTQWPGVVRQALAGERAAEVVLAEAPPEGEEVSDVGPQLEVGRLKSNAGLRLGSMRSQTLRLGSSSPGGGGAESKEEEPERAASPPPASKDRRIGRWRGSAKE
jgi:DNA uptake protein ComE-like DNA-binding protein